MRQEHILATVIGGEQTFSQVPGILFLGAISALLVYELIFWIKKWSNAVFIVSVSAYFNILS